jgi:hypothetical protein
MKSMNLLAIFFLMARLASGQVYWSNNVPSKQAIRIASRFHIGMWEEDVTKILQTNGINYAISVGANSGWTRGYGLSDGFCLALNYTARAFPTNGGWWGGNGLLQAASIQSNGVDVFSISLAKAPMTPHRVTPISN